MLSCSPETGEKSLVGRADQARSATHGTGSSEVRCVLGAGQCRCTGGSETGRARQSPRESCKRTAARLRPGTRAESGAIARQPFRPRKGGGAGVKPSVLRQAQIASAAIWPQSIPLAMDSLFSAAGPLEMAASEVARARIERCSAGRVRASRALHRPPGRPRPGEKLPEPARLRWGGQRCSGARCR